MTQSLHEEIINEIGTQTLARFGLNIFSLNTYGAYGASVTATNVVSETYFRQNKSKNNQETQSQKDNRKSSSRGYIFEDLDVGQRNITSELLNRKEITYTTDEISDIKSVHGMINDGKKYDNLDDAAKNKYDRIISNYTQEQINEVVNNKNLKFTYNDTSTDTVTIDKDGNIIQKSQHKVIKNTEGFFEKEKLYTEDGKKLKDANGNQVYKKDKNGNFIYKYLENNDVLTMPFDDYKRHKENLENMINNQNLTPEKMVAAKKALTMLNKNNVTNRVMCDNPKTTAVITQSIVASGHIVQAGLSDAIVVALSTLANGAIFEIKDAFSDNGSSVVIEERIKRLLKKVLESFKEPFQRGASFGAIDIGIGILSQIFKSIASKLKLLWKELRTSLKSIFNAIWDFFSGKIKTYKELFSIIIKGLLSAILVVGIVTFETQLEGFLAPLVSPIVASFLAPALSIVIGSIALVLMTKTIDLALNTLFGVFAQKDISKMKAEEVSKLCEELLPSLIEDRKELEELIKNTYKERKLTFETSFEDFKLGLSTNNIDSLISGLNGINSLYGKKLQFSTQKEFNDFMCSDKVFNF
jgi:hypothetical protein